MQMPLPLRLRGRDALLQDLLGLLDVLPVQVDGVGVDAAGRVVLAEDVRRGLPVVGVCGGAVAFALFGELVGGRAVAGSVGGVGLWVVSGGWLVRRNRGGCGGARGRGVGVTDGGEGVGEVYLVETCGALVVFLSGEGAEPVVFLLDVGAGAVVEGCVCGGSG